MNTSRPTATGTLEQTPLAHLLLYIQQRRQSGTLLVRWGSRAREDSVWIHLRAGQIDRVRAPAAQHDGLAALSPLCARDEGTFAYYDTLDLVAGVPT